MRLASSWWIAHVAALAMFFVAGEVRPLHAGEWAVPERVIELPGPEMLPAGAGQFDVRVLARRTGAGVFSNVQSATSAAQEFRYRRGISSGCELAFAGSFNELSVTPVSTAFRAGSTGMPVFGGSIKFRLPDQIWGWRLVFGTGASLVGALDRPRFEPDDFVRFDPTFAMASRWLGENLRVELAFQRSRVLSTDKNDGTNLTTFDAGLELFMSAHLSLQLEALSERISMRTVGDFGTTTGLDGVVANLGLRYEPSPATQIQVYGRRVNQAQNAEVGIAWGLRL